MIISVFLAPKHRLLPFYNPYISGSALEYTTTSQVALPCGRIHSGKKISVDRLREVVIYDPETGIFTWRIKRSGRAKIGRVAASGRPGGYIGIKIDGQMYAAHRLAWLYMHGEWPEHDIDHINGVRHDNKIKNLRDVTTSVNGQNQRKATAKSQTQQLGCHPQRNRFQAEIKVNGRIKYLGLFDTPEEGHEAYLQAKRRLHEGCTI